MYDSHYDLLTYILMKKDDLSFIKNLCSILYRPNNICGGTLNLYYMSRKDMKDELGITKINPIEDLRYASEVIDSYDLLPNRENFQLGIEGCDFVEISDLPILYNLGLRSINPIYNEDNQYGGGAHGNKEQGLTELGKEFIQAACALGIGIDISHANRKTTMDILNLIEELKVENPNIRVYASHSNAQDLCNRSRNLSFEELTKLKHVGGTVGLLCRKTFCGLYSEEAVINNEVDYKGDLIKHLNYLVSIMGIDNVTIASDDMSYHPDSFLAKDNAIFNIENINYELRQLLHNYGFDEESIEKLLVNNFEKKILQRENNEIVKRI